MQNITLEEIEKQSEKARNVDSEEFTRFISERMSRRDLLVVKVKSGINVKADLMDHCRKEILRQKETGVVLLPWFLEAEVVPEDVEVQFIDPKSSCVLEEGLE